MIRTVTLEDYKAHVKTTLTLGQLTVVVGPNGTGKTSVMEALLLFSELVREAASTILQGGRAPRNILRGGAKEFGIGETGTRENGSTWAAALRVRGGPRLVHWESALTVPGPIAARGNNLSLSSVNSDEQLWTELQSAALFRFDARAIAAPGYTTSAEPSVQHSGGNTAAVLAAMKLSEDERFDAVTVALRQVVPSVTKVAPAQAPEFAAEGRNGYALTFDFGEAKGLPASSASDGTLIILAILTAINAPTRPRLILLDDIEHGLHPPQGRMRHQDRRRHQLLPVR